MKKLQILENKPFSDMDFNLFETFEQKFLKFLHYLDKPNHSFIVIPKDLAFRIEKQANFFEKGQKELKSIIIDFLTGKHEKNMEKSEKSEEKLEKNMKKTEKSEKNEENLEKHEENLEKSDKSDEKYEKSDKNGRKTLRFRAYSFTKYDYNKIFHYRYYSAYLKRLKKKAFSSIFTIKTTFSHRAL